jgi:antirestriction protein ArdC
LKLANLYAQVTNTIVTELESGAVPWIRPWRNTAPVGTVMPHNAATNRPYSGINIPILWGAALGGGYDCHLWMTYKQALAGGAQVRGGEHGTIVVFTKKLKVGDEDEERLVSMLRTYTVFNVAQIDGLTETEPVILTEVERINAVEAFVKATDADIKTGGNQPMYVPSLDYIVMPPAGAFRTVEHFYATELHELAHWTAAEKRLNRDLKNRFGTKAYAAEELVAELTAAFLCAHLGIQGELRHAGYIADWIRLLKEDDRAIFTAASKASQAADFLRAFSEDTSAEENEPPT